MLNLSFAVVEIFIALWTNSLAVLSNSLHDFGDSFSLGLSWYFDRVSKKNRSDNFTYGYKRFSIVPVIINSVILSVGSAYILFQALQRVFNPQTIKAEGMIIFAIAGITINLIAYLRLRSGRTLNERSASLHLLDDVLGLSSVLVISLVMKFYYVPILDPILSIIITVFVLTKIFQNFKSANLILLQAVPEEIDLGSLKKKLEAIDGIKSIHDFHAWTLDGINHILTVHLVANDDKDLTRIKCKARELIEDSGINHPTIEIENSSESCELSKC